MFLCFQHFVYFRKQRIYLHIMPIFGALLVCFNSYVENYRGTQIFRIRYAKFAGQVRRFCRAGTQNLPTILLYEKNIKKTPTEEAAAVRKNFLEKTRPAYAVRRNSAVCGRRHGASPHDPTGGLRPPDSRWGHCPQTPLCECGMRNS